MNRLIDLMVKNYKLVLITLIILTIPFAYFYAKQKFFNHIDIYFSKNDPDIRYYKEFQKVFGNEEVAAIVFKSRDIFTPENIQIIRQITRVAQSLEGVQKVMSITEAEIAVGFEDTVDFERIVPDEMELTLENLEESRKKCMSRDVLAGNIISEDGTTTAIMIELEAFGSNEIKKTILNKIRDKAEEVTKGKVTLHYSGGPYLEVEINNLTRTDNMKFTPITFCIIIFVVYFMLRNFTLSMLGQLNIIVIVMWGLGFLIMCGETINSVTVIIAPILLAISIADSIHILSFYKEEFEKNGHRHIEAVTSSAKSLWLPCLFTSITTGIGYFSFVTTNVRPVKTVGIFTGIGVMFAFFMTIFFLPTVLISFKGLIEKNTKAGMEKTIRKRAISNERFSKLMTRLGNLVVSNYKAIGVVFLIISAICSMGITKLRFETDFVSYLKDSNTLKKDIYFIEENIRGTVPVELVVQARSKEWDFTHPESLKMIEQIQKDVMAHMSGRYTTSFTAADYFKEINKAFNDGDDKYHAIPDTRVDLMDYYELGDEEVLERIISPDRMEARVSFASYFGSTKKSKKFTRYLESHVKPLLGEKYTYTFTGLSSLYIKMDKNLKISQVRSFGTAFILIFIMMFFVCKNAKLSVISMIPNLFPIFVTLGIMGWFNIPLDSSTIMIASVTIGIAVDDTIHFITWFRRNRLAGMDTEASILKTFKDTGKPIVMTSLVLCIAYFVLMTGSVKPIIAFGALAGLAMFFALLGDLFILPAVIMIFKPKFKPLDLKNQNTEDITVNKRTFVEAVE